MASSEKDCSVITMTAKTMDGSAVKAGREVRIISVENNVAIVLENKDSGL